MEQINFKKITHIINGCIVMCAVFISFSSLTITQVYAQEVVPRATPVDDSQGATAVNGIPESDESTSDKVEGTASDLAKGTAECSVGQILANGLKQIFTDALAGIAKDKAVEATTAKTEVPVHAASTDDTIRPLVGKDVTALKIKGVPLLPSWDAMAYCLINSIIDYITYSTIQWINSGFQGNPAFVENPKQFFQDVADVQAGAFFEEISNGFLCEQFDIEVQLGLLQHQTCNYGDICYAQSRCTLSDVVDNVESFVNQGDFNEGGLTGFFNLTQNQNNNPHGAALQGQLELDRRIRVEQNKLKLELDWGDGFLSFTDSETGEITTPGKVIETQLNERLGSAGRRIEMADEFDEIVNALVNQLVKIALDKILTETREEDDDNGSILDPLGLF